MKNKKALRIFSTSFLLGALLITQPSFAQIANDDLASNVGLEISDEKERSNVKAMLADNVSDNFEIKNFKMNVLDDFGTSPTSKISFDLISKSNKPYKAGDYIEIIAKGLGYLGHSPNVVQDGKQIATMIYNVESRPKSKKDSAYNTNVGADRIIKVIFNENIVGRNDIKMHLNLEARPGLRYAIDDDEERGKSVDYFYTFHIKGQNETKSEVKSHVSTIVYPFGNTYIYNDKNSNSNYKSDLKFFLSNGGKKGGVNKTDLKGERFTAEIDNGFDISSIKKGDIINSDNSTIFDEDYTLNRPYKIEYKKVDSTGQLKVVDVIQGKGDEPSKIVVEVLNSIPVGKGYSYEIDGLSYKKPVNFNTSEGDVPRGKLLANDDTLWAYKNTSVLNIVSNRKDNSASSTEQTVKTETKTEPIKFERETRNNPNLAKGETKVIQKGVNGTKEITYKVYLENGKEVKREKVSEKVTKQPVKEIVEVGTLETTTKEEKKTETIAFEKETRETKDLEEGKTRVVQKGVNGTKEITYKVTYENGKEVKREKVSEKITKEPVKEITEIGTKKVVSAKPIEDIATTTKTTKETIKAKVEYEADDTLEFEKQKEVKKPVDGEKEITTVSQKGKDDIVTEKETKKAVDGLIKIGNKKVETETKDGVTTTTTTVYEVDKETGKLVNPKVTVKKTAKIGTIEDIAKTTKEFKEVEDIKFETITRENKNAPKGEVKVVQKGAKGKKEITYKVVYENGKEISREKVSEQVVQDVLNEVIEVGTKEKDVKQTSKKEPKKETKQEKQAEKIEQTKKPEPKNLPKAGVETELGTLIAGGLTATAGAYVLNKKKKDEE